MSNGGGIALVSLTVSPAARSLLRAAGFVSLRDLDGVKPLALARELNLDPAEALRLLNEIRSAAQQCPAQIGAAGAASGHPMSTSALDLLSKSTRSLVTFCRPLDHILGGGIPFEEITELCGAPGCGKTQLGMQLTVNVSIPECMGGVDGEALYVDTEGSFTTERTQAMAEAMLLHLKRTAARQPDVKTKEMMERAVCEIGGPEGVLRRIHYCRVLARSEQLSLGRIVAEFAEKTPKLRLLVIDSVAFHFRYAIDDMALRARLLNGHAQELNALASKYKLVVVVVNHVTTKIARDLGSADCSDGSGDASYLVPALGESWSHAITNRIMMSITAKRWSSPEGLLVPIREAFLVKSPSRQPQAANYVVLRSGIRQVPKKRRRMDTAKAGGGSSSVNNDPTDVKRRAEPSG